MNPSYKFYRGCYRFARAAIGILYRLQVSGRENIPADAVIICANHSSNFDPFLVAFAFGINCHLHIIAKAELFRIPLISQILRKMGMISVNRGILDVSTIKSTFRYLQKNEKVVIFPEGTRASKDGSVSARSGAIKLAEHADVPIVPVYVPRRKPPFTRVHLVIGEAYRIDKQESKFTSDEYTQLANALMEKIKTLNPEPRGGGNELSSESGSQSTGDT